MSKFPGRVITDLAPAGYSVFFDGTGDWLQTPSNAAFGFGTGDATVEAWIYPTTVAGTQVFIDTRVSAAAGIGFYLSGSTLTVAKDFATNLLQGGTVTVNAWNHVAWTRSGSTNRLFLNGVQTTSTTDSTNYPTAKCVIGANDTGGQNLTGYISNVRIIKGTALYTAAFTPPTQLFNITNTQLLTCNSPAIIDQSSNNFAITVNGNSAVSTFTPFTAYVPYNPALGASTPGVWTVDEAMQAAATRQWNMYDPYFNLTTLLLHGNGTNGAQNNTFLDSSSNNFSITRNGNTTQGSFTPFSQTGWSNFFPNSANDSIGVTSTNAAFALGTGDFTIEGWFYLNNPTYAQGFFHINTAVNATANGYAAGITAAGLLQYYYNGTFINTNVTLASNTWYHIALVRSSGTLRIYVNGIVPSTGGSVSDTQNLGNSLCYVGLFYGTTGFCMTGYASNFRVVKGTAVYTTNFTPPTAPLTAITNTSFLTSQSNRFVDNSSNALSITTAGTPSVQPFSPFLPTRAYTPQTIGGSGYFDGSVDSLASTTDFESSTSISTFTIEGWVYPTTFSTLINVIGGMVVSSGDQKSIAAEVNTSGQVALYWFDGSIKRCTGNTVMQLNAWNYFAIVVTSNAIAIYVNKTTADTLSGTTTLTSRTQSTDLGVGAYYNNNSPAQYFNGYLASVRYSTVARTISSIPTAPLSSDSDVRWLLNFTNAGIYDGTMKNNLETVGNAQISTAVVKYGSGSMFFDGTGDYLVTPSSPVNTLGSGDFTIEFWAYPSNTSAGYRALVSSENYNGTTGGWSTYQNGTAIEVWLTSGQVINATSVLTATTWQHIALSRASGTVRLFVNGTSVASASSSAEWTGQRIFIGDNNVSGTDYFFNGYLDDIRITRGYARYTGNFTPQTSQWQDQ